MFTIASGANVGVRVGKNLHRQGKLNVSHEVLDAVFEGRRRLLGNDHDDTAAAIAALCEVLVALGEYRPHLGESIQAQNLT